MTIKFILRKTEYELEGTHTVIQALRELGFSNETHLVVRDGEMLTENDVLRDGNTVNLIAVISGG